jgi:hypothetical protein
MRRAVLAGAVLVATLAGKASAEPPGAPARADARERLDRVAVRWHARATGGVAQPQFITARELAFLTNLEALADGAAPDAPYADRHVRDALQRHITEAILAALPVDPAPAPAQVAGYAEAARGVLEQRVGGRSRLVAAAEREGIEAEELDAMLRRRARASWYLDRMVAPMLHPSELDLREAHQRGETPYTGRKFEEAQDELRRWLVAARLASALDGYFRNIRSRVAVQLVRW